MTFEGKAPVQICQELIAIYSARLEAAQRLLSVYPDAAEEIKIREIEQSSEQIIAKLSEELTMFGDAVQSEVDRSNDYLKSITQLADLANPGNERDAIGNFFQAEEELNRIREQILTESELPQQLEEIVRS